MAHYSHVHDLLRYDGIPREITVHRVSESCCIIARHSTSQLGNSTSLTLLWFSASPGMLGSDMGPYPSSMTKAWNLIRFTRLSRWHYALQTLHHNYYGDKGRVGMNITWGLSL
jgi:hypothetical protein